MFKQFSYPNRKYICFEKNTEDYIMTDADIEKKENEVKTLLSTQGVNKFYSHIAVLLFIFSFFSQEMLHSE